MAGEEEVQARAVLAEMQMRILQGPHATLGLEDTASAEQVRAAFLQLTKQFHPARFGRMSPELHKLANEVFLGIKGAHDQLTRILGSSGRTPLRSSAPILGAGTVRGTGVASPTATTQSLARGTDRDARALTPPLTHPAGRTRPVTATPAIGSQHRTPTETPSRPQRETGQIPPLRTTAQTPVERTTEPMPSQRQTGPMASQRPTGQAPTPRSTAQMPPLARPPSNSRPTPHAGVPVQSQRPTPIGGPSQRPTSPGIAPIPRPGTTPSSPDALNPSTVRYSGAQPPQVSQPPSPVTSEHDEVGHAKELLTARNWTAARMALHALAARMPQMKQYRALLCYARGREAQAAGRHDHAAQEFQRAVQLDPDLVDAKLALAEAQRRR